MFINIRHNCAFPENSKKKKKKKNCEELLSTQTLDIEIHTEGNHGYKNIYCRVTPCQIIQTLAPFLTDLLEIFTGDRN